MKTKSKTPAVQKTPKVPTIHETANGRRYVIINKKRVWLASNISERDFLKWIIQRLHPIRKKRVAGVLKKPLIKPLIKPIAGVSSVSSVSSGDIERQKEKLTTLNENIIKLQAETKAKIANIPLALMPPPKKKQTKVTVKLLNGAEQEYDIDEDLENIYKDVQASHQRDIDIQKQEIQKGKEEIKKAKDARDKIQADIERQAKILEQAENTEKQLLQDNKQIGVQLKKTQDERTKDAVKANAQAVNAFKEKYKLTAKKPELVKLAKDHNISTQDPAYTKGYKYITNEVLVDVLAEKGILNMQQLYKNSLKLKEKPSGKTSKTATLASNKVVKTPIKTTGEINAEYEKLKSADKKAVDNELSLIDKVDPEEEQMPPLETVEEAKKRVGILRHNYLDKLENRTPEEEDEVNKLFSKYEKDILAGNGKRKGNGKTSDDGMNTNDINKLMGKYKGQYLGCIGSDQINSVILPQVKPHTRICWVMNTSKSTAKDGGQHWLAVLIDARPNGSHSIEFYNSLGNNGIEAMPKDFIKKLTPILKKLQTNTYMKVKQNVIKEQNARSSNCGEFCIKFLIDRLNNKSFVQSTNWDKKGEANIERWKLKQPEFKYIDAFHNK